MLKDTSVGRATLVQMTKTAALWLFFAASPIVLSADVSSPALVKSLDGTWRFLRDDAERVTASAVDFDDSAWRQVAVPHDWAIEGPFDARQSGWQGKLPWRGAGWYRRTFDLTPDEANAFALHERTAYLEFDGVMARPEVFVNGVKVGGWDYGYMSFSLDVTKCLKAGSNVLAVKASTRTHESRWYPGAGIYRSVRFVSRPKDHVLPGTLAITTQVRGLKVVDGLPKADAAIVDVRYRSSLTGPKTMSFEVKDPRLWDLLKGELYELDLLGERFTYGIRDFRFDPSEGFVLNGRRVQLKGVNLHSDMGPLGMAFDRDVMKRQLLIMKDMGANALRTSHNAPDPQVLELCDELGFFVWNECFDKWCGYAGRRDDENLEEYVSRNLRQFVRRDRNHPSVFCWSIGNEINPINHDGKPNGMTNARFACFRNAIREFDTTRPVAIGCCSGLGDLVDFNRLDLVGWNYGAGYRFVRKQYPNIPVLCSESASAVSEYGFYGHLPALTKTDYARDTLQVCSYDHNAAPWSDIPDVEFDRMAADRYCCGEFVWTGIDYLGEPTPIVPGKAFGITNANEQCARSSYFGAVDLCGIPKDRFYIYRSHWNHGNETVHVLPHWNWKGREGKGTPVYVYTSGDEAELFLNGRSLGRRRKGITPERANLAVGARATASSEEHKPGCAHRADDAIDASSETRWCARSGATNEWWQMDMGKSVSFDLLGIELEQDAGSYGYAVTLSEDGKSWNEHFRKPIGKGAGTVRRSGRGRYLRVTFTDLAEKVYASIRKVTLTRFEKTSDCYDSYYDVCSKYRLRWFDVPYEPGELKAVGYRNGMKIGEEVMRTAGDAVAVRLTDDPFNPPDAKTRFLQVDVVDAHGVRDPLSAADVRFSLTGPGEIVAVGNGNPKDCKSFKVVTHHPLHYGKCVAVVRRMGSGDIWLTASVEGLVKASMRIR